MFRTYLFFSVLLLTQGAWAACPWANYQSVLQIDSGRSTRSTPLSLQQVREDLACFRLVANNYIYEYPSPPTRLLQRLSKLEDNAQEMNALELMQKLFALHEGYLDTHAGYQLQEQELSLEVPEKKTVSLKQNLAPEQIHELGKLKYFRPADFLGTPTPAQENFIETFSTAQGDWVLDLRGNGGGDDTFAHRLASALFTAAQPIPQERLIQRSSLFVYAGLLNSIRALDYRGYEETEQQVLDLLKSTTTLAELLPAEDSDDSEELLGTRSEPFTGTLTILVDGGCASSCETVLEKLNQHRRVKVVGQNTYGSLHYSNPALYQLPHSGILVRMPTLYHLYENGAVEGVGYVPDVLTSEIDLDRL